MNESEDFTKPFPHTRPQEFTFDFLKQLDRESLLPVLNSDSLLITAILSTIIVTLAIR